MELNQKLAEWAGFVWHDRIGLWDDPIQGLISSILPNFIHSLDACFKWLVPKVVKCGYDLTMHSIIYTATKELGYDVEIKYKGEMISWIDDKDPALALCKAIEKLIDSA